MIQILITQIKENALLIIKGYDRIIMAALPKNMQDRASKLKNI